MTKPDTKLISSNEWKKRYRKLLREHSDASSMDLFEELVTKEIQPNALKVGRLEGAKAMVLECDNWATANQLRRKLPRQVVADMEKKDG